MISSNKRATRSRYSSPAQPPQGQQQTQQQTQPKTQTQTQQNGDWNDDGSGSGNGNGTGPLEVSKSFANEAASQKFLQNWLEPSVQTKTSYEEAGLMRYGVVENMAPLGSLPKPKKPSAENGPAVRRIILRPSGAGPKTASTKPAQEAASKPSKPRAASPPLSPRALLPPPPPPRRTSLVTKGTDDNEYDPKEGPRRRQSGRVPVPKKPRTSSSHRRSSLPTGRPDTPKRAPRPETPKRAPRPETPKRTPRLEPEDRDLVDKVVEAAVDEALKHYRYPTAWALRTLYDEKSGDANFVAMIEDVFSQAADAETMAAFSKLMEEKKREGKSENRGCYYFVPPSTNSRFTPHKPRPAPYAKLIHQHEPQTQPSRQKESKHSEARAAKKAKTLRETSHTTETPRTKARNKVNGSAKTPSRKRARRDSGSSDSSLSSAMSLSSPEGSSMQSESLSPSFRGEPGVAAAPGAGTGAGARARARAEATGAQSHDAPKPQPITTRRKSLACNKDVMSNGSEPTSPKHPSRTHQSTADATMPGRLAASDLFPNLPTKPAKATSEGVKAQHMPDEEDDSFWTRRRDAQKITNSFRAFESSIRLGQEREASPARKTRKTRHSLAAPTSTRATRSASKRPNEDVESTVSPVALSFYGEPDSVVGSRPGTPTTLRPAKKQKTGLRIKSSPMKKKGGTAAGVPRSMGEANMVLSNGAPRDPTSDNDEYCSACGNAGDVVCCDGCPRSFHFECVDMVQSEDLPDEWYCNECLIRKYPSRVPIYKGVFGSALNSLEKSIPRAFSLPKKIQNRFEGVRAGADGDYEEVVSNRAAKKRPGYEEAPDFFKQREDGQAVLCHACQTPATEIRAIIQCSACPFHWHIDCLDPPLAVPPVLKTWRCPAHVDDMLMDEPRLAPAHRFRKVKGNQPITPAITRGLKNNGYIEIDWEDELEDDSPGSGWPDPQSFGRSYKLPAKGIVLDFIEQLRHQDAGYGTRQEEPKWVVPHRLPLASDLNGPLMGSALDRRVSEMQTSLNLIGLQQKRSDGIGELTAALLSAADDNVLSLMAKGNADSIASGQLTTDDKTSLRAMLAQMDAMSARIRDVLGNDTQSHALPVMPAASSPPITEPFDSNESSERTKALAPVTEPTPPSTVDQGEGSMELD